MRILIDIGHPAHVHMFRCFAKEMQNRGSEVLFTCRDKEFEIKLLTAYGLKFINFGKKSKSSIGKIFDLIKFNWNEWRIAKKFRPDVFLSHGSITASHVAWLMNKPSIAFEDTFNMEQIRLWEPMVSSILTSMYNHPLKSNKVVRYKGYNELLYLHPNKFESSKNTLQRLQVKENEKYVILRFVSWGATHDKGHTGLSYENKVLAVKEFSKYAKVFISSEKPLPVELEEYRIPIQAEEMHDAMANATLIFGESATMVAEGVVMGVPGIYLDNTGRLYTQEFEEVYNMCYNYTESDIDQQLAIKKGVEILQLDNHTKFIEQHQKLINDNVDVTNFLVWFIENYPQSAKQTKENQENADFWTQFK